MKHSIATCDCQSGRFIQIKTVYEVQADAEVCEICGSYPVYIPREHHRSPVDLTVNWRIEFSQDLHDLLATWDKGEAKEDPDLMNYWKRSSNE